MKKNKQIAKQNTFTEFLLYTTPNGKVKVEIFLRDENLWLTQKRMADLFGVGIPAVNKHLKNIFETGELQEDSVISILEITAEDGKKYSTKLYNLDAIISVGYRVNSAQATHFRVWATQVLKEYIIKGFAMDDERLKNPNNIFGKDYFEEQLARIRDIRSSERRFYQKITDIYAQCSADYDPNEEITKQFFATVQNKLHFAISGQTAAEIISNRVNSEKPNMGLTNWKNSPAGTIRKTDIGIAKNYLNEKELDGLNRIVTMYLDYAEMQAQKGVVLYMKDWVEKLDAFLQFNEKEILQDSGKISHEVAVALAENEYEKYRVIQDHKLESDFDREVKKLLASKNKFTPLDKKTDNAEAGKKGGKIAKKARLELESKTGKSIITSENYLPPANKQKRLKSKLNNHGDEE
ncbi:MAG: virulence RhuM family protein [Acidobacteria bacterium]|nr:virulence RhuM family protein [Acidobacteriota bacterium]